MLRKSFNNDKVFNDSIDEAVEQRKNIKATWDEFYEFYLKRGFKRKEIQIIKEAIQEYSKVAAIMIVPKDDLYYDLKVDSTDEDDDKIMIQISEKLQLAPYSEGELIDNNISTVRDLFEYIKLKQQQLKANNETLFLNK
ncbi:hypothetical protein [Nonlabens sp.]|uniref:hypothetical protein n=1 Tax=Nonlabens sp. TaxID=1888209 RepID=UPI003266294D